MTLSTTSSADQAGPTDDKNPSTIDRPAHSWLDNSQGIIIGALLLSLAVALFREATILTGGVAGIALLIEYATPVPFEIAFLALNVPFFFLAMARMGWQFTLSTLVTIALVSGLTALISRVMVIDEINPVFAALAGAVLNGVGIVALFRHRSGVGGLTILSHYLQEKGIARAGHVHLVTDLAIMAAALLIIPADRVALSMLTALIFSFVLSANHRPGRYFG